MDVRTEHYTLIDLVVHSEQIKPSLRLCQSVLSLVLEYSLVNLIDR